MATPLFVDVDGLASASQTDVIGVATSSTAGNRLVAFVFETDNQMDDVTVTPPAGFSLITPPGQVVRMATGHAQVTGRLYEKLVCGANEVVTFNWVHPSGPIYPGVLIFEVSGAHPTTPTDVADPGTSGSANPLTVVSPPTTRSDVLFLAFFASGNKDLHTLPTASTFTLDQVVSSGGAGSTAKVTASALHKSASAVGEAATASVNVAGGAAHSFVGLIIGVPGPGAGGGGGGGAGAAAATAAGMKPTDDGTVHRSLSGQYFGTIPNLATAQKIAANFDIEVANVDTNPTTNAITLDRFGGFVDEMRTTNPSFKALPYTKGPQITEGVGYYPNDYYSHNCPWPTGAKLTTFSASIYVAQPFVAGQSAFVDPRGWTAHSYKEQRARDSWAIVDRYNTLMGTGAVPDPLTGVMADSMGTSSYKGTNCNPATGTKYTQAQWLAQVQQIGDELRARASGRLVIANGLISGSSYFGGGGGQALLDHVDGGLAENWLRNNYGAPTAFHSEAAWQQDVDMVKDANDRGKLFWGIVNLCNSVAGSGACSFTAAQIEQWWRYSIATYLLSNCGWSLFEFVTNTNTIKGWDEDHPYLHVNLGASLDGPSTALGKRHTEPGQPAGNTTYVYRDRRVNGVVYVNPTPNPVLVTFDRDYKNPPGMTAASRPAGSTATLSPNTGTVLVTSSLAANAGAPTVAITGPAVAVKTASVIATATATDPDGVALAEVRLNSGAWLPMTLSAGVWQRALTLVSGANTIDVRATDANSAPLTSAPVTRTVTYTPNAAAPTVAFTTPPGTVVDPTMLVTVTASDPDGIASVELMVNGGSWVAMTDAGGGTYTRSITGLSGSNVLQARATDLHPEPRTSAPVSYGVTVTGGGGGPPPPPPPTPDPGQVPNLGQGAWHAALLPRGGGSPRRFAAWSTFLFNIEPNATGEATLVINGADKVDACAQLLADVEPWANEIGLYRETPAHPGGRLEWCGPVTRVQLPPGGAQATITARDVSVWLQRRTIHHDHDYNQSGVDLTMMFFDLVADAMEPDPSPNLQTAGALVGRVADRAYAAGAHLMADKAIADLSSAGLLWTVKRRELLAMPLDPQEQTTLLDEHFNTGIGEDEDGLSFATRWGARGSGGGTTDTIYGQADAPADPLARYGLLEQVADASEITTPDDAQAYAAQLAGTANQPSSMLLGGALSPLAPVTFDLLVPHTALRVIKAKGVRPLVQTRIVSRVSVQGSQQGELVSILFEGQGG